MEWSIESQLLIILSQQSSREYQQGGKENFKENSEIRW